MKRTRSIAAILVALALAGALWVSGPSGPDEHPHRSSPPRGGSGPDAEDPSARAARTEGSAMAPDPSRTAEPKGTSAAPEPDRPGATERDDARSFRVAPIVETDAWARSALWSRGATVVVLPGRFEERPGLEVTAQVLDSGGQVLVESRPCPVLAVFPEELVTVLPTGPRKDRGRVRVRLSDGRATLDLEIPLAPFHEALATAESRVRRLIAFPGDSVVHRGYLGRTRAGGDRRAALDAAREQVQRIAEAIEAEARLSGPSSARLREATQRIRAESTAEIQQRADEGR